MRQPGGAVGPVSAAAIPLVGPSFCGTFVYGWKRAPVDRWEKATSRLAGAVGAVGFGLSILAAAGGAFFGSCTVTSYSAAFLGLGDFMQAVWRGEDYAFIRYSISVGVAVGLIVGIASLVWLIRFCYTSSTFPPDHPAANP